MGRKMYIENVDELKLQNMRFTEEREARERRRDGEEGDDDDEDEDEEEGGEQGDTVFSFERQKKAGGGGAADDDEEDEKPRGGLLGGVEVSNPNIAKKKAPTMMKVKDLNDAEPVPEEAMSRRER